MTSRQLRYQRRNKVRGFCVICPRTTLVRRIYDPDTGLVLLDKPLIHCARHWLYYKKEYDDNKSISKRTS